MATEAQKFTLNNVGKNGLAVPHRGISKLKSSRIDESERPEASEAHVFQPEKNISAKHQPVAGCICSFMGSIIQFN